jgi:hypothetical protein
MPERNWWKIGFIASLVGLEIMREALVVQAASEPRLAVLKNIYSTDDGVFASGVWSRADKGKSQVVPNTVQFSCWRASGECDITYSSFHDGYAMLPTASTAKADFEGDGVVLKESGACMETIVRIDPALDKATSLRRKTGKDNSKLCKGMEDRLESVLIDGHEFKSEEKDQFLPIFHFLRWVFKLF